MAAGFSGERQFSGRAFFTCLMISLSVMGFGYPTAILGTTLSQPSFLSYMHLIDEEGKSTSNATQLIGATSGVYQAGAAVGIFIIIWMMDKFGRRKALFATSVVGIIGAIGCCASQNMAMFIVFRGITGSSSWSTLAISPVFISEIAPPKLRGAFVTLTGVLFMVGQALASYMGLAFFSVQNNPALNWRGPLGIQILFPSIALVSTFFLPESPRWLLMHDQVEKASEVVKKLHGSDTKSQEFAMAEFHQMSKQAEPSYRKRFELVLVWAFVAQSTGILVISAYGSVLYSTLGYDAHSQIVFQCGYITVAVFFNIVGDLIIDHVGRRKLMIFGLISVTFWLIIETVMVALYASPASDPPNRAGLAMGVAALYLYIAFFTPTIDTAGFTIYGEIFPNHLRAKGVASAIFMSALIDIPYLESASTAFANIGWRFFLVFIIIPTLGVIYVIIRFPETKGLPLEEVARLFGDEHEVMVWSDNIVIDHDHHELVFKDGEQEKQQLQSGGHFDKEGIARPTSVSHVEMS